MDGEIVENMWEMVKSLRGVRLRVGGRNPKSVWWNNEIKTAVKRQMADWKEELGGRDDDSKERCMETYKEEKRKVERYIYQSKKKVNEQFGRKINEDLNGNRKLFWKEVSYVKGGKVESCSRVKDRSGRLAKGEDEVQRVWKDYY